MKFRFGSFASWLLIFILSISPFLLRSAVFFLSDPPVWPDEAIFTNSARTLATTGTIATNLFGETIPGLKQHANWYPPLYIYALAGWTNIFGTTIESVRSLSFVLSLCSFAILYFILLELFSGKLYVMLGLLLFSLDLNIGEASRLARMDMMNFFFLCLAFYGYLRSMKPGISITYRTISLLIAGISSSLAVVTHPLGLIAPVVIVLHQGMAAVVQKQNNSRTKVLYDMMLVLLPTLLLGGLWLFSMRDSWSFFLKQYDLQFQRKIPYTPYPHILFQRFVSWKALFSIYFISLTLFAFEAIRKIHIKHLFLLIGFIVSFAVIEWGKENWYILYVHPFILCILIANLSMALKAKRRLAITITTILLSGYVCLQLYFIWSLRTTVDSPSDTYYSFANRVQSLIPAGSSVLLATIPDPYFILSKNPKITLYEFLTVPIDEDKYRQFLDAIDIAVTNMTPDDYVVNYLNVNTKHVIGVGVKNRYHADIHILVPRDKRK